MIKINLYLGEVVIGLGISLLSGWFIFNSILLPIRWDGGNVGAGAFPLVISSLCFILALCLTIFSLIQVLKKRIHVIEFNKLPRIVGAMASFILFIILMPLIGFYITALLLIPVLLVISSENQWKRIVLITGGFILFSWVGFDLMLGVPLP